MNKELKQLFDEDQQDLRTMPHDRIERDRKRRSRVKLIIDGGSATDGIDFIHAAIIYQHGESLEDFWQAYQLSLKAVELGFKPKWLAAVALDRWLLKQGKPLKYGNQVVEFGGVYRIPKIEQETKDEVREHWDIPSFEELFSFDNLRGFVNSEIVATAVNDRLKINIVKLERPPVHTPSLKGIIYGSTNENQTIYENSFGWRWIENSRGIFELGWILMPDVPVIAHAVAGEGIAAIERVELAGCSCFLVKFNESKTLYVKNSAGIWSITGINESHVIKKAQDLIKGSIT
ncbi:hypothetical protein [Jeotgalibacillus proteolyticus]|uniref:Uncharacterized protein n=1 Tax=Jeotgalibacillus proteolyticus TaxID=2082395 RepID=A0A2S5G987_9BACL|nr:hypothetical protein [Jeotgalibacillus proteolyticus]PPA69539.1 hypothetical protein C4B60_13400 [Jeotgalibacillus proteolyticus]